MLACYSTLLCAHVLYNHMLYCTSYTSCTLLYILQATKFKLRAELWKRQSIEDGGLFIKYFAVLEKGRLDFYLKEKVHNNLRTLCRT